MASSRPQLPPLQTTRLPLTLITRKGAVVVSSRKRTAGEVSPPSAKVGTQASGVSRSAAWRLSITHWPGAAVGESSKRRTSRAASRAESS